MPTLRIRRPRGLGAESGCGGAATEGGRWRLLVLVRGKGYPFLPLLPPSSLPP